MLCCTNTTEKQNNCRWFSLHSWNRHDSSTCKIFKIPTLLCKLRKLRVRSNWNIKKIKKYFILVLKGHNNYNFFLSKCTLLFSICNTCFWSFCFNSKLILQNRTFIAVQLCEKLKNAGFISLKNAKNICRAFSYLSCSIANIENSHKTIGNTVICCAWQGSQIKTRHWFRISMKHY